MEENGSIWNNGGNYPQYNIPSITETANTNKGVNNFLDPTSWFTNNGEGFVQGFWNDLMGFTSQNREFAQQEYLQDKMNEYNTPSNQMARMKEAGINPNLAASGIAGSGNESAQAPAVASNAGGVQQGMSALSGAVQTAFGVPGQLAAAEEAVAAAGEHDANATRTNTLTPWEQKVLRSQNFLNWQTGNFNRQQAIGLTIENQYRGDQCILDLATKMVNIDKIISERDLIDQQFFTEMHKINLMNSEIRKNDSYASLAEKQAAVAAAEAQAIRLQNWYQQQTNAFMAKWKFDPMWPSNSIMLAIAGDTSLSPQDRVNRIKGMLDISFANTFTSTNAAEAAKFDFAKGLVQVQKEANVAESWEKRTDIPASIGVGPFKTSTNLRDFLHQKHNKK